MGRKLLFVGLALVSCNFLVAAEKGDVRPGMTPEEVRTALDGPPQKVARQILHGHYREVWYYEKSNSWIEFDCRKGQESRVINVQSGIRPKP